MLIARSVQNVKKAKEILLRKSHLSKIAGTGIKVPDRVLTNKYFESIVDTSDEWIRERSGIVERRKLEDNQNLSDLAAEAGLNALEDAKLKPEELDAIIIGTVTGDMQFPSTACFVQEKIKAVNAFAFDLAAACSGYIYSLSIADSLISTGHCKNVLVIGAEVLTRITDYEDRTTCVLFGDGAGAAVLTPSNNESRVIDFFLKSDGRLNHLLYMPGGGTRYPTSHQTVDERMHFIKMAGREVFKAAVTAMGDSAEFVLTRNNLTGDDIDLLIPHQANMRIIQATAKRVRIPMERVMVNVNRYGNTSSASIPLAIQEAKDEGRIKPGTLVLLVAFGAGFTWASALIRF